MKLRNNRRSLAFAGAIMAVSLTTAACGGGEEETATDVGAGASDEATEMESEMESEMDSEMDSEMETEMESESMDPAMAGPFGAACAEVPTEGEGSVEGMSDDPVATAASNNPLLSTLVTAVGAAGLVDTLNTTDDITVFAPANSAFEAVDPAALQGLLADKAGLTNVLTYHVVPGRLAPEDLAGEHVTLQGAPLTVEGEGEDFTVNGSAAVVCGNVQTANATVYLIDMVLMPPAA